MAPKPELIPIFLDYKESLSLQDKQTTLFTSSVTVLCPHMTFSKIALILKSRGGAFSYSVWPQMGTGWSASAQFRSEGPCLLVITPVLSVRTHQAYKRTAQHRNQNLVKMAASDAFPLHSYPRDSSFPLNTLAKIFLQAGDENQGSCQFHLCFLRCAKICCKAKFFVFFFFY